MLASLMRTVNCGMIGGGTVGGGVLQALDRNGSLLASRLGARIKIHKVAVRDLNRPRKVEIPKSLLTDNWRAVVEDPKTDIVIELAGGTTTAKTMVLAALRAGKPVITANKALLSAHGQELCAAAAQHNTNLYYEAAVAGGIPVIKALREGFVGNRITHIYGIVNGTCNYILSRMKAEGVNFSDVLAEAQALGYAEAEPSLDVDGYDSQHKVGLLASLAHGFWIGPDAVHVEGIRNVSQLDVQFASALGYTIKLLGIVKKTGAKVQASVYPALIPDSHVLASVSGVFNAVFIRGDIAGDSLFYGQGAGQDATASAVVSDIADAVLDLKSGTPHRIPPFKTHNHKSAVLPVDAAVSKYYLRLSVVDKPGVLAKVAAILAKSRIGISSVIQPEGHEGESVPLILMIHDAKNSAMLNALKAITRLPAIREQPVMFRVENLD
jgi:homoserine dehydrogenase